MANLQTTVITGYLDLSNSTPGNQVGNLWYDSTSNTMKITTDTSGNGVNL